MTKEMYEDLLERNKLQISELNTLTEEQDRHIVELEKENAKLKKELKISQRCWQDQKNISLNANCSLHKAKEIIKDFILMAKVERLKDRYETVDEAEQFINELENGGMTQELIMIE